MTGDITHLGYQTPPAGKHLRRGDRVICSTVEEFHALWPGASFSSLNPDFYANTIKLVFGHLQVDSSVNSAYRCDRSTQMVGRYPRFAISIETVLEGSLRRRQQGVEYVQKAGMSSITNLNEPFCYEWEGPGRSIRTVTDTSVLQSRLRRPHAIRTGLVHPSILVRSYVQFLKELAGLAHPQVVNERTLESSLFALHENILIASMQAQPSPQGLRGQIEETIHAHLGDPSLSPRHVAEVLNVSVRSVHAAFSVDGITLAAEVRRQRVLEAARILQINSQPDRLADIASQTGFSSTDAFRRSFIAVVGMTPSQYRLQHQP